MTDPTRPPPRSTLSRSVALRNEAIQMYGYEYDLACHRLAELRDAAPRVPFEKMRKVVEDDLGEPLGDRAAAQ